MFFSGIIGGLSVVGTNIAAGLIMIFVGIFFGLTAAIALFVLGKVDNSRHSSVQKLPCFILLITCLQDTHRCWMSSCSNNSPPCIVFHHVHVYNVYVTSGCVCVLTSHCGTGCCRQNRKRSNHCTLYDLFISENVIPDERCMRYLCKQCSQSKGS